MNVEIVNYYETLVIDDIKAKLREENQALDIDFIADVACVALNSLPAHYVRHVIDTSFFMSEEDHRKAMYEVNKAVDKAMAYIETRGNSKPDGTTRSTGKRS